MAFEAWDLEPYNLALTIAHAEKGAYQLEKAMQELFERDIRSGWTRNFEAAVKLFDEEFGQDKGDWTRQAFVNGCNGISWDISDLDGTEYVGSGETDALALCCAMVRAKLNDQRHCF
ncbi:hypothetical protein RHSP_31873 [Rhizobium freirei PRF 81]|uniref:Uncharacterized protein n=2 Tax=Rhizobium freirei TaxID=1353277 RepID=N6U740_9HYPH|nr:hypothetical protein RHSP_31873 [Rhizobium freirei PRF 81]